MREHFLDWICFFCFYHDVFEFLLLFNLIENFYKLENLSFISIILIHFYTKKYFEKPTVSTRLNIPYWILSMKSWQLLTLGNATLYRTLTTSWFLMPSPGWFILVLENNLLGTVLVLPSLPTINWLDRTSCYDPLSFLEVSRV